MITGEIKNKLDRLWDAMWSNQMTNPWIDIQQVTYLIFIKSPTANQRRSVSMLYFCKKSGRLLVKIAFVLPNHHQKDAFRTKYDRSLNV